MLEFKVCVFHSSFAAIAQPLCLDLEVSFFLFFMTIRSSQFYFRFICSLQAVDEFLTRLNWPSSDARNWNMAVKFLMARKFNVDRAIKLYEEHEVSSVHAGRLARWRVVVVVSCSRVIGHLEEPAKERGPLLHRPGRRGVPQRLGERKVHYSGNRSRHSEFLQDWQKEGRRRGQIWLQPVLINWQLSFEPCKKSCLIVRRFFSPKPFVKNQPVCALFTVRLHTSSGAQNSELITLKTLVYQLDAALEK